jgi:hypothetical protein
MPRRDRVRRTAAAALVPLALATMTACGGDDSADSSSPSSPSVASGTASESPEASPSTSPTPTAGQSVDPDRFLAMFERALEQEKTAHLKMSMKGARVSMEAEGDVDYSDEPPAIAMTLNGDQLGDGTEVRMVDGVMYLKTPMFGDKFLRMDLSDPNNPLGERFSRMFDLRSVLDNFRSGLRSVTLVGEEDVEGEPMRHYRVTMDPSEAVGEADPSGSATEDVPETVTYDVWFDGDGLFRRMEADLGPDDGALTVVLSDWGADVTIEPPPSGEVTGLPGER